MPKKRVERDRCGAQRIGPPRVTCDRAFGHLGPHRGHDDLGRTWYWVNELERALRLTRADTPADPVS